MHVSCIRFRCVASRCAQLLTFPSRQFTTSMYRCLDVARMQTSPQLGRAHHAAHVIAFCMSVLGSAGSATPCTAAPRGDTWESAIRRGLPKRTWRVYERSNDRNAFMYAETDHYCRRCHTSTIGFTLVDKGQPDLSRSQGSLLCM